MATCRSCGAPIRWENTVTGRKMPLDAEPVLEVGRGVFSLNEDDLLVAEAARPLFRSHFATCPNADEHRKGH